MTTMLETMAQLSGLQALRSAIDMLIQVAAENPTLAVKFTTSQERARFLAIRANIKAAIDAIKAGNWEPAA